MSNYVSQIFVRGPKEAVNRALEESIPNIGTRKVVKEEGAEIMVLLCLDEEDWYVLNEKGFSLKELVNHYGVTIFEDVYNTDCEADYCSTTIIEPGDGEPKTTVIEPRHSLSGYEDAFSQLIEYDPERYRRVKIEALEALREIIYRDINEERMKLLLERAKANNGRLFIPADVTEIEPYYFSSLPIVSIEADPANTTFCAEGNCLLSKDGKTVILGCNNSVITKGVTEIGCYAFSGCKELESINVPEGVKIWRGAFDGCPCAADFEDRYVVDDTDDWINEVLTEIPQKNNQ